VIPGNPNLLEIRIEKFDGRFPMPMTAEERLTKKREQARKRYVIGQKRPVPGMNSKVAQARRAYNIFRTLPAPEFVPEVDPLNEDKERY